MIFFLSAGLDQKPPTFFFKYYYYFKNELLSISLAILTVKMNNF